MLAAHCARPVTQKLKPRKLLLKGWEAIPRKFAPAKISCYTYGSSILSKVGKGRHAYVHARALPHHLRSVWAWNIAIAWLPYENMGKLQTIIKGYVNQKFGFITFLRSCCPAWAYTPSSVAQTNNPRRVPDPSLKEKDHRHNYVNSK